MPGQSPFHALLDPLRGEINHSQRLIITVKAHASVIVLWPLKQIDPHCLNRPKEYLSRLFHTLNESEEHAYSSILKVASWRRDSKYFPGCGSVWIAVTMLFAIAINKLQSSLIEYLLRGILNRLTEELTCEVQPERCVLPTFAGKHSRK